MTTIGNLRARARARGCCCGCPRALLALLFFAGAGCSAEENSVRFEIAFASGVRAERAALIQARIDEGACGSESPVYVSDFAPGEQGERPPALGRGRYAFSARALDAECFWYASGCREVSLPDDGEVIAVELLPLATEIRDCDTPACRAAACLPMPDAGGPLGGSAGHSGLRDAAADDEDAATDDDAGAPQPDAGPPLPLDPVLVAIEAEAAEMLSEPLKRGEDPNASGGAFISYPYDAAQPLMERQALKRAVPPGSDDEGGLAVYTFDLPRSDNYRLWGRVISSTLDEDSFWLRIDDQPWMQWNDIAHAAEWHWVDIRPFEQRIDRFIIPLDAGRHTLRVSYRELGTRLDRVLIVSDLAYVPRAP